MFQTEITSVFSDYKNYALTAKKEKMRKIKKKIKIVYNPIFRFLC